MSNNISWREQFININCNTSVTLRVLFRVVGDVFPDENQPTLIHSHGMLCCQNVEEHSPVRKYLEEIPKSWRVVVYDTRAHGKSTAGLLPEEHSWKGLGEDLLALADALCCSKFVASGLSMGSGASLYASVIQPEKIAALILILAPTAWESRATQTGGMLKTIDLLTQNGVDGFDSFYNKFEQGVKSSKDVLGGNAQQFLLSEVKQFKENNNLNNLLLIYKGSSISDFPSRDLIKEKIGINASTTHNKPPILLLPISNDNGHPISTCTELEKLFPTEQISTIIMEDMSEIVSSKIKESISSTLNTAVCNK